MTEKKYVCVYDYKEEAEKRLDSKAKAYYNSGATRETTMADNENAFSRWLFMPRILRGTGTRLLSTNFLGVDVDSPIAFSPTAALKMGHPDGELASARAAKKNGNAVIYSTFSSYSIEEICAAHREQTNEKGLNPPIWFQLYVVRDREVTAQLIKKAEKAGVKALVVTVDLPIFGPRYEYLRNPGEFTAGNFREQIGSEQRSLKEIINLTDPDLTFRGIMEWLKANTQLPILLKGIMVPEDARLAFEYGAAGIFVSNHGGRQLDSVPASIDVLKQCIDAVPSSFPVYFDGGVRTGEDCLKALALGAKGVFIGRPVLWSLACEGQLGVEKTYRFLRNELDIAMACCGVTNVKNVDKSLVIHRTTFESRL